MTMVEKIQRAIFHGINDHPINIGIRLEGCGPAALAVLKAMREPSDAMALSVGSEWGSALEDNWRAMIDAAIAEASA